MKSILDPSFRYVPAAATDLRKTFARVRREQAKRAADAAPKSSAPASVVTVLRKHARP